MAFVARVIFGICRVGVHPIFLISFIGPTVLTINLKLLRLAVNFPYGSSDISGAYIGLKASLNDPWSYALMDYYSQFYTLVLAFILFWIEVGGLTYRFLHTSQKFSIALDRLRSSKLKLSILVLVFIEFFGGTHLLISGALASAETVSLYLPSGKQLIEGSIHFPTLESPITWARGTLVVAGILLALWRQQIDRETMTL